MADKIRIAILGCGAITRSAHLPSVVAHPELQLVALVDADIKRARLLAGALGAQCQIGADYRSIFGCVDAIINALPNNMHATVNQEALIAGLHVLCEKPLATTAADALACCELAQQKNRLLAVGMNRRFVDSHDLLRLVLDQGVLGTLDSYDWEWGGSFDWRSASGFYFSQALAGGGALIDFGVHLLDSVIDWFGPVSWFDYKDDDWGSGIEANAILDLQHNGSQGNVKGRLRVSRTYTLKNRFLLRGTLANAEIPVAAPEVVILHRELGGTPVSQTFRLENSSSSNSYSNQLDNFVESIRGRQKLKVDGWQALRVIELVEGCYNHKRRIAEPWAELQVENSGVSGVSWQEQTIFVTGATGFIGGRVCERLVQAGATRVRALVHSAHHAARIARLPIELSPGNLLDPSSLRLALADARLVIHCGLGDARGIVRGTENLLRICIQAGVKRFVHISTAAVYGLTPPLGCETEDAPVRFTRDQYCDNKARAEQAVLKFAKRGMPAVILRPSIVFGPFSAWSTRLIEDLRNNRVVLIDGGRGACNTTYVDNLVDAIFLSLENERAVGHTFFITDGEAITWGDFVRAHIAILQHESELREISRGQIAEYYKKRPGLMTASLKATGRVLRSREFRQMLLQIPATHRLLTGAWSWLASLPEERREQVRARVGVPRQVPSVASNGQYMPDEVTYATQTTTIFFRIDKARELLGYRPQVSFNQGMRLVEAWLRFANYL